MRDLKEFRRACYEAARRTRGRVTDFQYSDFDECVIVYRDRTVAIMCNRDGVLAITEPRSIDFSEGWVDGNPLTYLDEPELVAVLAGQPGFRVLTRAELLGPPDAEAWGISAYDLKCWRPATLGDALFNFWD